MAITKIMHMKEAKGKNPALHLKNAIGYIMDPIKTNNGLLVGGLGSLGAQAAYQQFLDTKKFFQKEDKRQGYHFVLSFKEGEVDEKTASQITQEFTDLYLKNNYDYVSAVHNDTKHIHSHIIFNSVNYDGYKYRYEKGDWAKYIQPITNKICEKYGLSEMNFDEEKMIHQNVSYNQWEAEQKGKSWNDQIKKDILSALEECKTYEGVLDYLKENGYEIRKGTSKDHGRYLSLKPFGKKKAVRTYQLGPGFSVEELEARMEGFPQAGEEKIQQKEWIREGTGKVARGIKQKREIPSPYINHCFFRQGHKSGYRPNWYLLIGIRYIRMLTNTGKRTRSTAWRYKKDLLRIHELEKQCSLIFNKNLSSPKSMKEERCKCMDAMGRLELMQKEVWKYYGRNKTEFQLLKEYQSLEGQTYAGAEERRKQIQHQLPLQESTQKYEGYRQQLAELRYQKKEVKGELKLLDAIESDLSEWGAAGRSETKKPPEQLQDRRGEEKSSEEKKRTGKRR